MMSKTKIMTTAAGCPVADNQNSITAGPRGPILMQDVHLFEKLAHFNRERVPERVVHAKGAGAYGNRFGLGALSEEQLKSLSLYGDVGEAGGKQWPPPDFETSFGITGIDVGSWQRSLRDLLFGFRLMALRKQRLGLKKIYGIHSIPRK